MEDQLEEIKRLVDEQKFSSKPTVLIPAHVNWMIEEIEYLRERNFHLKIYESFGQSHDHEDCVAEIARLRKLLLQFSE